MNIKENIKTLIIEKPLKLDCGEVIVDYPLSYETYGNLNKNIPEAKKRLNHLREEMHR